MPRTPGFSDNGMTRRDIFRIGAGLFAAAAVLEVTGCSTAPSPTKTVGETASAQAPTATETLSSSEKILSPKDVRNLSPEQRLASIRVPKDLMDKPEALVQRYLDVSDAIFNCGSDFDEYMAWLKSYNGRGPTYAEYVTDTYYKPLYSQLHGEDITKVNDKHDPRVSGLYNIGVRLAGSLDATRDKLPGAVVAKMQNKLLGVSSDNNGTIRYSFIGTDGIDEKAAAAIRHENLPDFNVRSGAPVHLKSDISYSTSSETVVFHESYDTSS